MSSYIGRHAKLYDLFYADKPYEEEVRFVHGCFHKFAGQPVRKILELACGTGRHAMFLARLGYQITALDHSKPMLEVAQKRTAISRDAITIREGDMRKLSTPLEHFDAAICLFDSIGYVQTDVALTEVFTGVHRSLKRGGLFVFEFWHAPAMLKGYDPVRVRRFPTPDGIVLRISETVLRPCNSTAEVTYSIYDLRHDGYYESFVETQTNRFFTHAEMKDWAQRTHFRPLAFYSGFTDAEQLTEQTWHVVAVFQAL